MQDCYVGDIGDYGKFALLREMHRQGLSIGINWYKTDAITSEKQNDGKYCIPDRLTVYDTDLSTRLKKIFYSQDSIVRSIKALEAEQLIGGALYYSDCVPVGHREKWHQHALSALSGSDLVFLDPDNGMIVSSAEKDKQKQRKYVLDAEFKDYLCTGHSVVIYQHRPRVNEAVYIDRMMQRFMSLSPDVRRSDVQVITFPRYSVRDYFAISINEDHRLKIKRAISNLVNGVWGSGKKPMCRLPISIENALSNETPNSPTKLHSPTKPVSNVGERNDPELTVWSRLSDQQKGDGQGAETH